MSFNRSYKRLAAKLSRVIIISLSTLLAGCVLHAEDVSTAHARSSPAWLRDGVIYEVFPRNFSAEGTFNSITARLDDLKNLGADILWLMPIQPIGEKMRK